MKTLRVLLYLTIIYSLMFSCKNNDVEDTNSFRVKQIVSMNIQGIELNKIILNYTDEKLISEIQFDKDTVKNIWNEAYHLNFNYSNDRIISIKSKLDSVSNSWKNIYKTEYYISNSRIDKVMGYDLEKSTGSSSIGNTISYQYSDGVLKELIAYDIKWTLSYENNLLSQFVEYSINLGNWKEYSKCKYNYSVNQLKDIFFYSYDNYGFANTEPTGKFEYDYTNGNISKIMFSYFSSSNSTWKVQYSTFYKYDNQNCLIEKNEDNSCKTTYEYEVGKGNFSLFNNCVSELYKTPFPKVISKDKSNLLLYNQPLFNNIFRFPCPM